MAGSSLPGCGSDVGRSLFYVTRPNSVCVVHPKTGEEAWWPLFDEAGDQLFSELMPELDAIKEQTVGGLVFRRDHGHRRARVPLPWITPRGGLDYLRATVKFERPGFATSLALRHFATAGLRKERTPIAPIPAARSRTPPVGAAVADVREADLEAACFRRP